MVFAAPLLAETPAAGGIDQRASRIDQRRDDAPAFSDSLARESSRGQPRETAHDRESPAEKPDLSADEARPAAEAAPAADAESRTSKDTTDRADAQPVRTKERGRGADEAQSPRTQADAKAGTDAVQPTQPGGAGESQIAEAIAAALLAGATAARNAGGGEQPAADSAAQPTAHAAAGAGTTQADAAATARPAAGNALISGLTAIGEADAQASLGGQAQQHSPGQDQHPADQRPQRPVLEAFLARSAGTADAPPASDATPVQAQAQTQTQPAPDAGAQAARAAVSTSIENQSAVQATKAPAPPPPPPASSQPGGEDAQTLASVSRGLAAAVRQRGGSVTIRLAPESLGAMRIQMTIQNGTVNVRFEAASDQARDLLHRHVDTLRQTLEQKGFGVERIQVQTSQPGAQESRPNAQHDAQDQGRQRPDHDAGGGRSKGSFDRRDGEPERHPAGAPEEESTFFERWTVSVNATA